MRQDTKELFIVTFSIVFLFHRPSIESCAPLVSNTLNGVVNQVGSLALPPLPIVATPVDLIECYYETLSSDYKNDPDIHRRMPELVSAHDYNVETHTVTTDDGYILTVYRVRNETKLNRSLKVVLLNHGLTSSSAQWFLQKGNRNLGMGLADAGYDVWATNHRGCSYSTGHVNLTQDDKKYWDFSWHEMGVYDVPAVIKYILKVTQRTKLYYVGHSMGTTQFLVAMSIHPHLNKKIQTAFLLAPAAYMSHSTSIIRQLAFLGYEERYLTTQLIVGRNKPSNDSKLFNTSLGEVCTSTELTCPVCNNLIYLNSGYDAAQADYPRLAVALSKFPDTASTKCSVHYAQSMSYYPPSFRQFDYMSPEENEKHYGPGVTLPPFYNLTKVTCKTVVIYALNDNLATPTDSKITFSKIGSAPQNKRNKLVEVSWRLFNHLDFAVAKDADKLVYSTIYNEMKP